MIKFYLISLFLLSTIWIYAQSQLSLILLNGEASIILNEKSTTIKRAYKISIPENSTINLSKGTKAIIYDNERKTELMFKEAKSISYDNLILLLEQKKPDSASKKFIDYMNSIYTSNKENDRRAGSLGGAASRGSDLPDFSYTPIDGSTILCDTLKLKWNNSGYPIIDSICIIEEISQDTVYIQPNENDNWIEIGPLQAGDYYWSYTIQQDNTLLYFKNTFIVPTPGKKNKILKEIKTFQSSLLYLDPELSSILKKDYLQYHKLVL